MVSRCLIFPSQHCASWIRGAARVMVQGSWSLEPGVKPGGSQEDSPWLQCVPGPVGVTRLLCFVAISPQPLQRIFLVLGFSLSFLKIPIKSKTPRARNDAHGCVPFPSYCCWGTCGDAVRWLARREEVFLSAVIATRKYCFDGDQIKN